MEKKTIFGTEKFQTEVCECHSTVKNHSGVQEIFTGVSLLLHRDGRVMMENKQPMFVVLTKEDAKELAIQLLKMSSIPIPQVGGLSIDNYGEWGFTLYHAKQEDGELCNEPIMCINEIQADDISEDGNIAISLTNESAKDLISGLATIV